jgi:hypothetical protein
MDSDGTAPISKQGWTITLVHGTWGRGFFKLDKPTKTPRWFEDNSQFRDTITATLAFWNMPAATFEVCKWSGQNSITARERAARQLADHLNSQRRANPSAPQLVIAHSHGGNVAVRAIEYLEGPRNHVFVATIATPFIEMFPRVETFESTRYWFFLYPVLIGVYALLYRMGMIEYSRIFLYALVGTAVLAMIGVRSDLGKGALEKWRRARERFGERLVRYTSHEGLRQGKADFLIIRGIDDEATLSIAAGAIGRKLAIFNVQLLDRIDDGARWIFYLLFLPLLGVFFLPRSLVESYMDGFLITAAYMLVGIIAIAGLVIVISNAFAAMCLAVYGKELFMSSFSPQVSTGSAPDSPGPIAIYTLTRTDFPSPGFRHFIYNERGCAHYIVRWAMARIEGKTYLELLDQRRGFAAGAAQLRKRLGIVD